MRKTFQLAGCRGVDGRVEVCRGLTTRERPRRGSPLGKSPADHCSDCSEIWAVTWASA